MGVVTPDQEHSSSEDEDIFLIIYKITGLSEMVWLILTARGFLFNFRSIYTVSEGMKTNAERPQLEGSNLYAVLKHSVTYFRLLF